MRQDPVPTSVGDAPTSGVGARSGAWRMEVAALALFAALAVAHTWPLAAAPGRWSRNDSGDTLLNEWAIAWVAHQSVTDPIHLFDANIFYPEKRTLAFSEHLLPQAAMVAPLLWAGGSPVLAHNLALLLGFILTGWAMCHMIRVWTGSWESGLVAGSLAAFNAHTLIRVAHLQAQHLEFLPLALLALDRALAAPRVRHALWLAVWFACQALTSGYMLVFAAVSMVCATAARADEWIGQRFRRVAPLLVLSAVLAGLLILPFMLPYRFVRQEYGLVRTLGEVAGYSAVLTDYLATGARVHAAWSAHFLRGDGLFPGVFALVLATTTVATGLAWRDRRARMLLAIAVATCCFSFGVNFPPYPWLFRTVPLFDAIRAAIRFGQLTLLAVAALAGYGVSWWLAKLPTRRARLIVAAVLIGFVNLEALRAPMGYVEYHGESPVFKRLAAQPHAVIACFPFYHDGGAVGANGHYMLSSTLHWRPMLNGYSGFMPPSFYRHATGVRTFPLPESIAYLKQAGVTHVVVDTARLSQHRVELLQQAPGLRLWAADAGIRIYVLEGQVGR